jgi:putative heme-binding domain-containing protein
MRALRHKLEAFHDHVDPTAVAIAWPQLGNSDRHIRYAARIAIERQPVSEWKSKALAETNPQVAMEALLALARVGKSDASEDLLKALQLFDFSSLGEELQLAKLRVIEVAVSRNGPPIPALAKPILDELDPLYPSYSIPLNKELSQILLALAAPGAIDRTLALIESAKTADEQLAYAIALRHIKEGWSDEQRRTYFSWFNRDFMHSDHPDDLYRWFNEAGRAYANGNSFNGFVARIRTGALDNVPETSRQQTQLAGVLNSYRPPARRGGARGNIAGGPTTAQVPRELVKDWTVEDFDDSLGMFSSGRDFTRAQNAYNVAQCNVCHAIAGTNATGGVGPDLTSIAARFRRRDMLESIVLPSKVVSEQFADTMFRLKNGEPFVGRVIEDTEARVVLQTNPLLPQRVELQKAQIDSRFMSPLSPMPAGLINTLSREEVLDLIAYIEAGGREDHPNFKK